MLNKFYIVAFLNIITLNINGLNNERKQLSLINYLNFHKIDIALLQEHNVRESNNICQKLNDLYHVILNLSVSHNGGTAILIDKKLNCTNNATGTELVFR